jgi:hypothetical protein
VPHRILSGWRSKQAGKARTTRAAGIDRPHADGPTLHRRLRSRFAKGAAQVQ